MSGWVSTFKLRRPGAGLPNETIMGDTTMENPWLRGYAVLLATCTALLFITGPAVSINQARPLYSLGQTQIWLAAVVGVPTAGLAFWLGGLASSRLRWVPTLSTVCLASQQNSKVMGIGKMASRRQWNELVRSMNPAVVAKCRTY